MTCQEKIETLRGALCDYHDICDNRPDCFACDDTHACGELNGLGGPEEDGMCYDSYQSDVPGDGTIFHRARVVRTETDRSPSETPDLAGDLGRKTDSPLSGFGKPTTGEIQFSGDGTVFHRARLMTNSVGTAHTETDCH